MTPKGAVLPPDFDWIPACSQNRIMEIHMALMNTHQYRESLTLRKP
jgi:hypothetical protein